MFVGDGGTNHQEARSVDWDILAVYDQWHHWKASLFEHERAIARGGGQDQDLKVQRLGEEEAELFAESHNWTDQVHSRSKRPNIWRIQGCNGRTAAKKAVTARGR